MPQALAKNSNKHLFGFKDLLKKTWEVYRKNWKKLTLTVLTAFSGIVLLILILVIAILPIMKISEGTNKTIGMAFMATIFIAGGLTISVIMNSIIYFSAIQAVKENPVSIKNAIKISFEKFWKILCVVLRVIFYAWGWFLGTIVVGLIGFTIINLLLSNKIDWTSGITKAGVGGFAVGILTFIFGIITFFLGGYRTIRAHFSLQALLESNKTSKEALKKSKQVTKNNFWKILGYYGCISIIPTLLLIAIIIVINVLVSSQAIEETIGGIAQFIFSMIMTSFVAVWKYIFFKGLEQEKKSA